METTATTITATELFAANQHLAMAAVKRWKKLEGGLQDDVMQEAQKALWTCCQNFEKTKTAEEFTRYAAWHIRSYLVDWYNKYVKKHLVDTLDITKIKDITDVSDDLHVTNFTNSVIDSLDLRNAMDKLSNQQQHIINALYGLTAKPIATMRQLAEQHNCAVSTIDRIHKQAMDLIKADMQEGRYEQ